MRIKNLIAANYFMSANYAKTRLQFFFVLMTLAGFGAAHAEQVSSVQSSCPTDYIEMQYCWADPKPADDQTLFHIAKRVRVCLDGHLGSHAQYAYLFGGTRKMTTYYVNNVATNSGIIYPLGSEQFFFIAKHTEEISYIEFYSGQLVLKDAHGKVTGKATFKCRGLDQGNKNKPFIHNDRDDDSGFPPPRDYRYY